MRDFTPELRAFINTLVCSFPGQANYTRKQVNSARGRNIKGHREFVSNPVFKLGHGTYYVPPMVDTTDFGDEVPAESPVTQESKNEETIDMKTTVAEPTPPITLAESFVPKLNNDFVPFGDFTLLQNVIESKKFFPILITGESGNGKTEMVYQACGRTKRELLRANITANTDEEDLIGGFRLVDGATVWHHGPAAEAMMRGAVLLLDEVDLGTPKIMCLQPVLEGKAIFVKKLGKYIEPAPGFTVIATANTKGKGSTSGRYIGTNVMNEAFMDRFPICMEHEYPSKKIEKKILTKILQNAGQANAENLDFVERLTEWAQLIRKTFKEEGISEQITTRRLIHIIDFFLCAIPNRQKAIQFNINRFDAETVQAFLSFYQKVDESIKFVDSDATDDDNDDAEEDSAPKKTAKKSQNNTDIPPEQLKAVQSFIDDFKKNA